MDAKVTLSFDESVISKAKKFAEEHNMSLSRLVEYLLGNITSKKYKTLEELPVADWVYKISEGHVEYRTRPRARKETKEEFYKSRK